MTRFILTILLCATLAWPGLAQDSAQPSGTIAVEDSLQQDAAIANRIRDILGELEGYGDVTVTVSNGIVTLRGTTLEAAQSDALNDLVGRVEGVVQIENKVTETTDLIERLSPAMQRFSDRFIQIINYIPLLLVAGCVFAIVVLLGFWIARLRQPWNKLAPNAFIAEIYRTLLRLGFVIGGLVIALDILGATALLSPILGAAGIIGLAIGFAVRDTVENFIASIMLSIRQPFRPKDVIEIGGDMGKVIRLTSRATILLSFDGNHIRIPNATVFKSRIVNYTRNAERRFSFQIGIDSSAQIETIRKLAEETVQAQPFTLDQPAASTWIEAITDAGVILNITGWIDQTKTSLVSAKGEALRQVKLAVENAGVEIPDTTYRLRLDPPWQVPAPTDDVQAQPTKPAVATPVQDIQKEADTHVDVGADTDKELEAMVEAERAETHDDDLLRTDAQQE